MVTCIPGEFCRWFPSGDVESVTLLTEDLRIAYWPGIEGSPPRRTCARYGTDDLWPRSEQEIEALYAFVSYEDTDYRVRAGRQQRTNGLGYYNFDGASFLWRGFDPVRIDVYGGWSLARNLNAPRTGSLLEDADEFAPDDQGWILGFDVQGRIGSYATGAFTYQREIRDDRLALYTERVAGDVGIGFAGLRGPCGRLRPRLRGVHQASAVPVPVVAGVEAMRAAPIHAVLRAWTIWGAFSPVGFDEARGWLAWSSSGGEVRLVRIQDLRGHHTGAQFVDLEDDGWRAFGRAAAGTAKDGSRMAPTGRRKDREPPGTGATSPWAATSAPVATCRSTSPPRRTSPNSVSGSR